MYLADCQFSGLAQPQKRPDQNAARLRALSEHKVNERFNWIDEEVDLASFSTFCTRVPDYTNFLIKALESTTEYYKEDSRERIE